MIRLYGFATEAERDWFRLMQGVQGVGAKVALAILGVLSTSALALAVAGGDRTAVARAPGRRAEARRPHRAGAEGQGAGRRHRRDRHAGCGEPGAPLPRNVEDAVSALVNLGYGRPQAAAPWGPPWRRSGAEAQTAALIRGGLKALSM